MSALQQERGTREKRQNSFKSGERLKMESQTPLKQSKERIGGREMYRGKGERKGY